MFDIQNYTSFLAAIVIFQLIPGAGTLAILNATARNGIGAGFGAVLGTLAGDFLFMVAAAAGLAAVMNSNPIFFQALQWFGAAYLCRLGLQLLRFRWRGSHNIRNLISRHGATFAKRARSALPIPKSCCSLSHSSRCFFVRDRRTLRSSQ